ncbi:poly(A) RNA polymerase gld-2 homolog A-like isoform X2 [Ceratina calcarata]|nr:poly(A) RNA polymerase gld-2 homolog A-like isoform X2 [Ceratina calcarata]
MGGQQANGQCLPIQSHAMHMHGASAYHQSEYAKYRSDGCSQNRHQMIQTGSYPLELLQLMGVEIPSLRRIDYVQSNGGGTPPGHWPRRVNTSNGSPVLPSPHLPYRPSNNSLANKKSNWYKKLSTRTPYRDTSFGNNDKYGSDNGFSPRSPVPNKHHVDGSQTESSDERDSVGSSIDQSMKKSHKPQPTNDNRVTQYGVISSSSPHQYYQAQRPLDCYPPTSLATSRTQVQQTYQNKRRYHSGTMTNGERVSFRRLFQGSEITFLGRNSPPLQRVPRNKRFLGMLPPNYNAFPRCGIAPDRFLARSHLVEVTHTPEDLLDGSIWDRLSTDVWSKFMLNQQTENVYTKKMMLWRYLYIYIKGTFPKYGLFLVGSTMNGFGSDNSDVDMCLLVRHTEMDQRNEAVGHLEQILKCLKRCGTRSAEFLVSHRCTLFNTFLSLFSTDFIEQLELIQAKVPILKFHDSIQNLEVDLNCNNAVGIRNTHLLYCYSRIDWRVRPLVLVVKLWAQSQDINDAKNMTISSYSLVLMVIHFLQCGVNPPVLPCLHSLYEGKFGPHTDIHFIDIQEELDVPASALRLRNRQSLGELLVEFFRYYVTFDFSQYAISVRLADKIPIEDCRRARSYKNDPHQWKYLCIEEPFDLTNTARSVYDPEVFARIKHIFDCTYQNLKEYHDLARIFVKVNSSSSPYIVT